MCSDPKLISEEVYRFYADFYSSFYSKEDSVTLFENIKTHIPTINTNFAELCDSGIEMWELDKAVKGISLGKAPGQDGLSSNFY